MGAGQTTTKTHWTQKQSTPFDWHGFIFSISTPATARSKRNVICNNNYTELQGHERRQQACQTSNSQTEGLTVAHIKSINLNVQRVSDLGVDMKNSTPHGQTSALYNYMNLKYKHIISSCACCVQAFSSQVPETCKT